MKVAVIGAGIAGLTCAGQLSTHGLDVTVFEKSRGPSGRMATRRAEEALQFDHGAQYFTIRDARFRQAVEQWMEAGVVAEWDARIVAITEGEVEWKVDQPRRFVGTSRMSAIGRHLAEETPVIRFQTRVGAIQRRDLRWVVIDDQGESLGWFDTVLISAPAPQTTFLLADMPLLRRVASRVSMHGCWAAMIALADPLEVDFDAAFVNESILSWIARNNSKPGRPQTPETWVVHGSAAWSDATLEEAPDTVLPQMLQELQAVTGVREINPIYATCHRWRYAIPRQPLEERMLYEQSTRIGACGDWCGGPRVEGAYLSGLHLAERVLES